MKSNMWTLYVFQVGLVAVLSAGLSTGDPPPWKCPPPCTCSKSGDSVNCEGKRLTAVPKGIPSVVETLYLDHNNFVVLGENSFFNFTHLTKLYLRNSQIQTILPGAFRDLPLLKELYLTNNRISRIPPPAFQDVDTLSLLNLQANTMTSIPDLSSLPGLKKLYLEANQIQNATFPEGYVSLKALNAIVLSNNNITVLTNQTFAMLSNSSSVRRLEIARNGLKNVSAGALRPLSFLQSLKIGWNPLDGRQLQNVLEGLSQDLNLESLDIRSINLGGTLPSLSFSILSRTPLRTLIFNHNTLRRIPERAFAHLPKLVQLDLSSCKVQEVADNAFMDLPDLQNLFLNDNPDITSVPKNLPANLLRLYLQGDGISALRRGDFQDLTQLRELYLSKNAIYEVAEDSFVGLMNLRILHVQSNKLSYIPSKLLFPLTNLRTLILKNNNIRSLKPSPGAMTAQAELTFLDMSGNQCSYIPYELFSQLGSLQTLLLDDNELDGLISGDARGQILGHLSKLQKLGLSNNNLHYIHDAQFRNLFELQHLNLRNNRLSSWGPRLFYTPGTMKKTLRTVDLSMNQISLVNETSVRDLQHLHKLNLSSNPFACTCDLRWFRGWLNSTTVDVVNLTSYKCNSPAAWNGKPLLDFGPDKIDCTNYTWYYVGASISVTFVIALIVFAVIYRHRWFIRLRLYRLGKAFSQRGVGRRDGYEEMEGHNAPGKDFDFYVIYAEEDMGWVIDNLLPTLDNGTTMQDREQRYQGRFSLYFEERDAIPGKIKVANYEDSMPRCRCALVVLSRYLKGDAWCEFLVEQAYHLKIEGLLDRIQILMVGRVPLREVPRPLHKAMERNEYREWLSVDNVEQAFVNYLQDALTNEPHARQQHYGAVEPALA
ncbi:uncharacterized protein LOC143285376 [Babylonia areolata]|uniref:uncharacterized protein LOC143285376 n=1 Tax=Babylonia areolata TaxID=304850 RepID=UPI003FD3EC86